jgi:hypothetical protein
VTTATSARASTAAREAASASTPLAQRCVALLSANVCMSHAAQTTGLHAVRCPVLNQLCLLRAAPAAGLLHANADVPAVLSPRKCVWRHFHQVVLRHRADVLQQPGLLQHASGLQPAAEVHHQQHHWRPHGQRPEVLPDNTDQLQWHVLHYPRQPAITAVLPQPQPGELLRRAAPVHLGRWHDGVLLELTGVPEERIVQWSHAAQVLPSGLPGLPQERLSGHLLPAQQVPLSCHSRQLLAMSLQALRCCTEELV